MVYSKVPAALSDLKSFQYTTLMWTLIFKYVGSVCILHVPIFVESALVVIGNRSTVYKRTLETPREPKLMRGEFSFLNEKIRTWLFLPTQLALSFPLVTLCQGAKPLTKKSSKITFCHIILEAREIDLCKELKIVILFGQLCDRC